MPWDSNYFEEASRLFQDSDPFVSRTAEILYQQMLAEYARSNASPQTGFNILYFFQSVIRWLLLERPDITLTSTAYPYPCEPICATNRPARLDRWNGNAGMWKRYIELVNADSDPSGDHFDVDYALRIISSAIDEHGELRDPGAEPQESVTNFDYWLSGFNSEQTS